MAAVARSASRKGAQQQAAADQNAALQQELAATQQQAAAAPAVDATSAELQSLANLHAQGILTDEEYSAAKAKALGI